LLCARSLGNGRDARNGDLADQEHILSRVVVLTLRTPVIPGRAAWREPGIQRWRRQDSGLLPRRPRNDGNNC